MQLTTRQGASLAALWAAVAGCLWIPDAELQARLDSDGDGLVWHEDCDDTDPDVTGPIEWFADADGDGWVSTLSVKACNAPSEQFVADGPSGDCDDQSPGVHPGATELCNSLDDDCDGHIDPASSADAPTWYFDGDRDGYGADDSTTPSCVSPGVGWMHTDGDCDDDDPSVHRGAEETWYDGVDSDCSGTSDYDADADGFDAASHGGDDCEDTLADVHPGAIEYCGDRLDNDCDGIFASCALDGAMQLSGAPFQTWSELTHPSGIGAALAPAGDIDGDGTADLLVGDENPAYAAFIALGPLTGDRPTHSLAIELTATQVGISGIGREVGALSDTDGDGYDELLLSAPYWLPDDYDSATGRGVVFLVSGPLTGGRHVVDEIAQLTILDDANIPGDHGKGLAWSTDPHICEGVVGVTRDTDRIWAMDVRGADGPTPAGDLSRAEWIAEGPETPVSLYSTMGDLSGDGDCNLLVRRDWTESGTSGHGDLAIVSASAQGSQGLEDALVVDDPALIGNAAVVGDLNGDGHTDLAVQADPLYIDSSAPTRVFVLAGPVSAISNLADSAVGVVEASEDSRTIGSWRGLASAGDFNGDGKGDILVRALNHSDAPWQAGVVHLVAGPIEGILSIDDSQAQLLGEAELDGAGTTVGRLGDTNGDGQDDFYIGAYGWDWPGDPESHGHGKAYVVYGG